MKKGSRLRKCHVCGCGIFWKIPDGSIFGIPTAKTVTIKDYLLRENEYWCIDCWERYQRMKGENHEYINYAGRPSEWISAHGEGSRSALLGFNHLAEFPDEFQVGNDSGKMPQEWIRQ